ncbi:glycosyltransferase family 2 protein [Agarilytica rhodophyticola]|uniref:glycosyltransferase family 2 protein n=1 Tax=Agarilytica rhodophyticola TaxID=1737490 RepID=UPI000B344D23|nr:glycosyltransferase family 2 protein [Agarilytica rhodophyticola]
MTDLVSIITPAYRAQSMIGEAVTSVLKQTHPHWQMFIIADDDTDYKKILREQNIVDERIHFLRTAAVQSGPNVARNVGLAQAEGDWIAPLDADDVYYPERLEKLIRAAQPTGLALDNVKIVGEGISSRTVLDAKPDQPFDFQAFKNSLVPLLLLFHKRHVHQGWDEDIIRGADTMFNLRALESAGYAGFIAEPYHEYRVHNQSMCHAEGSEDLFHRAYKHTLERLKSDGLGFQDPEFRQQVIAMIEEKRRINAAFDEAVKQGFKGNYQSFVKAQNLC